MRATTRTVSGGAIFFLLALSAGMAHAFGNYLTDFTTMYPTSATANASCQVCHTTNSNVGPRNVYGTAFGSNGHNFTAIETLNSDGVAGNNLAEITAGAQPGWCAVQTASGCLQTTGTPPAGLLDPVAANQPPVANAGANQAVNVGQTVQLNGSASTDPEGALLTYSWTLPTRPAGSTAALTNSTTVNPTFTPDAAGAYIAQLVVNDGTQNSAPASVTITATPAQNLPPVANAGPDQAVNVGQTVTLNGSGSTDPNANPLTYAWSFVSRPTGSAAALAGATTVNPTFVADAAGSYTVQLIVNDGQANSPADTVVVTTGNLPPVANAGPDQAVNVGQTVTLNGSGSTDPNANPLTYAWSFVSRPTGSAAALAGATTVNPTFVADAAGSYTVQLIVNDGQANSPADTVIIAATASNLRPTANAGPDQTVTVATTVTLDGSASSDPEGRPLTYRWFFVSQPAGSPAELQNPTTAKPFFTPALVGSYVVGLVVNDGTLDSTQTNVVVTAQAFSSDGGGCFIATAAFGSPLAPQVQTLRAIRDTYLLPYAPGRLLVQGYYAVSPAIADVIGRSETLRAVVRGALLPLVGWATLALWSPALGLGIPLLPLVGVWLVGRRARRR